MKYPIKSNWISYKKDYNTGMYIVRNHLGDEDDEYKMTREEIMFLNLLNGKRNPIAILVKKFGMTPDNAKIYINSLYSNGIIRKSNFISLGNLSFMLTVIKIKNSYKYRNIARFLFGLFWLSFIPIIHIGIINMKMLLIYEELPDVNDSIPYTLLGILFGLILGGALHELAHAVSCICFHGKVMEFGIAFQNFPAIYTLMDDKLISSRMGLIITELSGVLSNFWLSILSYCVCMHVTQYATFFFMISIINLELGMINLLFIEGLDGSNAIGQILGKPDIFKKCNRLLRKNKRRKNKRKTERQKAEIITAYIFKTTKILYPVLILFNLSMFLGW